ncbi:type II toxin-antitoxin system VapC family toxin [Butyrivibrio sp. WCD3002]|uniref:type II toxin-antitoxin system VapC family toxin n=1 Tax=Butyrivibrio sp. WCD3002 TaxID=1280676 RepID=UPI00047E90C8|nr:PIN domain-containing protein [Butyrivibrio sp. WCD3002]
MKLLVDTNVILDYFERRTGGEAAKKLFKLAEDNSHYECLTSSSVTDVLYLVTKAMVSKNKEQPEDKQLLRKDVEEQARDNVESFLSIMHILNVSEEHVHKAFKLRWHDTEDALQYVVAKDNAIDVIITNNKSDFEANDLRLMTAQEFLDSLPE